MKRKIIINIIIILSLSILSLSVFAITNSKSSKGGKFIVLTEDGFIPDKISIKKGESITFSTKLDKYFWPASDLHPTHEIYSDFDPKDPIAPNNTWSFRFNKVGKWNFHDHLSPYYTGTITVFE